MMWNVDNLLKKLYKLYIHYTLYSHTFTTSNCLQKLAVSNLLASFVTDYVIAHRRFTTTNTCAGFTFLFDDKRFSNIVPQAFDVAAALLHLYTLSFG